MSAKSRDSADSLDSEIVFDLSDETKRRWINFYKSRLTGAQEVRPAHSAVSDTQYRGISFLS